MSIIPEDVEQHHHHKDNTKELHNLLEESEIISIKEAFDNEDGRRMNSELLKEVIERIAHIKYDDEKFNLIFLRMNMAW